MADRRTALRLGWRIAYPRLEGPSQYAAGRASPAAPVLAGSADTASKVLPSTVVGVRREPFRLFLDPSTHHRVNLPWRPPDISAVPDDGAEEDAPPRSLTIRSLVGGQGGGDRRRVRDPRRGAFACDRSEAQTARRGPGWQAWIGSVSDEAGSALEAEATLSTSSAQRTTAPARMASFVRYIGVDYSGAETPTSSVRGLRVYGAKGSSLPTEILPPPSPRKYWTRRELAHALVRWLSEDIPTLSASTMRSRSRFGTSKSMASRATGTPSSATSAATGRPTRNTSTSTSCATVATETPGRGPGIAAGGG